MWYVYYKHFPTGKQDFVGAYDTAADAIKKMALLYANDKDLRCLGEYYYFMRFH